jgi:uncharacterized protein (DUF2336 family)
MMKSILEKSPEITPILVRLYDNHRLYGLLKEDAPQAKDELTNATAELFESELSASDHELLADLLICLMRQAESDLRQALSERLSIMENIPLRLILFFANDEISVASPVLRKSPVLSDLDLIYIIKSQGPDSWQAIADRGDLGPDVIDMLAGKKDPGTALVLAENDRIQLTSYAFEILIAKSENIEGLATPLAERSEITQELAQKLYKIAGKSLKASLSDELGQVDPHVTDQIDEVILEFTEQSKEYSFLPSEKQLIDAGKYASNGFLNLNIIMDTLKRGQLPFFIALLSKYTGLSPEYIHDILSEENSRNIALLCKAYDVLKGDFSSIYMMTQRLRTNDRIIDQKDLLSALAIYDKIDPALARKALGIK